MKEGYVIRNQTLPHFLTATVVDWIDIFSRKSYRDSIIECYCENDKIWDITVLLPLTTNCYIYKLNSAKSETFAER